MTPGRRAFITMGVMLIAIGVLVAPIAIVRPNLNTFNPSPQPTGTWTPAPFPTGTFTPTPQPTGTFTPTPTSTPTPTPTPNAFPMTQGALLGPRNVITATVAFQWNAILGYNGATSHIAYVSRSTSDFGMNMTRIMDVREQHAVGDWTGVTATVAALQSISTTVVVCMGPLVAVYDPNTAQFQTDTTAMLNAMVAGLPGGVTATNNVLIEPFSEYGVFTNTVPPEQNYLQMLDAFMAGVNAAQVANPGLNVKIVVPSIYRNDFVVLQKFLAYARSQGYNFYAISAHYYFNPQPFTDFPDWINEVYAIAQANGYGSLPIMITEYGYDGSSGPVDLTSNSAAWLASRQATTIPATTTLMISGLYGQVSWQPRGFLALYDGSGFTNATYPIGAELGLENQMTGTLYSVNGIPPALTNVGAVVDSAGNWLVWVTDNSRITFTVPSSVPLTPSIIGPVANGNSPWLIGYYGGAHPPGGWTNALKAQLANNSNPANDPFLGTPNVSLNPSGGLVTVVYQGPGVILLHG